MKLILVISLLSLTIANAFLFRVPSPEIASSQAPDSIRDYYTAVFAHFSLEQPRQILHCFDKKTTALYFDNLYEVSQLAQYAENRDNVKVHLTWAKLSLLHKALEPLEGCVAATQDYTDLLNALGFKERHPRLFMVAKYIYYQANFGTLAQELPKITGALDNEDWKGAGDLAGSLKQVIANDLKSKGLALHSLDALWNGVHIELGLPDAQDIWGCWDNETAKIRLEFVYGMANAVAEGKPREAAVNTEKWYEEKGSEMIKKIPASNWQCSKDSEDAKAENEALGIDMNSKEFYEKVNKFVHSHQAAYWHLQRAIKTSFEQLNFLHAGSAYASLMKAAAKLN